MLTDCNLTVNNVKTNIDDMIIQSYICIHTIYRVVISLGYAYIRVTMPDEGITPCAQLESAEAKCRARCSSGRTTFQVRLQEMSFGLVQLSCWRLLICVQDGSRGGLCWSRASSLTTSPRKR